MRDENVLMFNDLLANVDWFPFNVNDVGLLDYKVECFIDTLHLVVNRVFPLKQIGSKTTMPKPNKVFSSELSHVKHF